MLYLVIHAGLWSGCMLSSDTRMNIRGRSYHVPHNARVTITFCKQLPLIVDIDPLADLTWMIERLHSNATTMPPITQHKSAGLSVVRPPSTMSQRPPYAVDVGIETTCHIAEVGSGDVELRWKCTKPRSVLDKAGSTKSNISSYGTAVTTQVCLSLVPFRHSMGKERLAQHTGASTMCLTSLPGHAMVPAHLHAWHCC